MKAKELFPPITLFRIQLMLSTNGFQWTEVEFNGVDNKKTFIVTPKPKDRLDIESRQKKYVKKDKLMKIEETMWLDDHKRISRSIWCFPNDIESAKVALETAVKIKAGEMKKEFNAMIKHLK